MGLQGARSRNLIEWPTPPAHLAGGIGSGDFWQTGNAIVGLTMAFAGLHPHDRVLDVGCGLGRVAARSPSIPSAFAFITSLCNPSGAIRAEDFAFPWSDGAFTVAIASSIFTHLPPLATSNYLRQIARTLESGGRLFSSFFVLDDESRQLVRTRVTDPVAGGYSEVCRLHLRFVLSRTLAPVVRCVVPGHRHRATGDVAQGLLAFRLCIKKPSWLLTC
jgi:SAM-dependent methyltransferase